MLWQLNRQFSSHWVSAEQAPGDVNKKNVEISGSLFFDGKIQAKKMVSN